MTTNEIMANLEEMSKTIGNGIHSLASAIECLEDDNRIESELMLKSLASLNTRKKDFEWFKNWLDDLQEKHWKQEAQMQDATMFLHMND